MHREGNRQANSILTWCRDEQRDFEVTKGLFGVKMLVGEVVDNLYGLFLIWRKEDQPMFSC